MVLYLGLPVMMAEVDLCSKCFFLGGMLLEKILFSALPQEQCPFFFFHFVSVFPALLTLNQLETLPSAVSLYF